MLSQSVWTVGIVKFCPCPCPETGSVDKVCIPTFDHQKGVPSAATKVWALKIPVRVTRLIAKASALKTPSTPVICQTPFSAKINKEFWYAYNFWILKASGICISPPSVAKRVERYSEVGSLTWWHLPRSFVVSTSLENKIVPECLALSSPA